MAQKKTNNDSPFARIGAAIAGVVVGAAAGVVAAIASDPKKRREAAKFVNKAEKVATKKLGVLKTQAGKAMDKFEKELHKPIVKAKSKTKAKRK